MSSGHPPFRVRRLTVEAPLLEPLADTPQDECGHEVGWYSTTDYIERCAICGTILGPVRWKPK